MDKSRKRNGSCFKDSFKLYTRCDVEAYTACSLTLREIYPYICCCLCNGLLIDATTITECLHTFCKSCIVKHFFYSNKCPNCAIIVHQTKPLYNIRSDRQLQAIIYNFFPYLEEAEKIRIDAFYKEKGLKGNSQKEKHEDQVSQSVFTIPPELNVSLILEFIGAEKGIENYKPLESRYICVSGEATIHHVKLFIRRKMELSSDLQVDVICGEHLLEQHQSLREVKNLMGETALQDGMLALQFRLALSTD